MVDEFNVSSRVIMRIEVLPEAKQQLAYFCKRTGMSQVATSSRLVDWFCRLSDVIQAAILDVYPVNVRTQLPSMILKYIVEHKEA
jgi:hypothetical protein